MCIDCENSLNIPQGPVGPQGPIGPEGPMGPQGEQGIQGEPGTSFSPAGAVFWPTNVTLYTSYNAPVAGIIESGTYRLYVEVNILTSGTPYTFEFCFKNNGVLIPGSYRYGKIPANTAMTYVLTTEVFLTNSLTLAWVLQNGIGSATLKAGFGTATRLS